MLGIVPSDVLVDAGIRPPDIGTLFALVTFIPVVEKSRGDEDNIEGGRELDIECTEPRDNRRDNKGG
jgi:hypothetical protein